MREAINKQSFKQKMKAYTKSPTSFIMMALVYLAALLTILTLSFIIIYILVKGIPNIKPSLFALEYTSNNVSMLPAIINTIRCRFCHLSSGICKEG